VGTSGTGGGMEKFCAGEIDIADASRTIKDEEKAACEAKGITYAELPVALDGISIVVNPENDWATCLTVDELKTLWNTGSTVKTWKDLKPEFPADPITLYGPDDASGTYEFFNDEIIGGDEPAPRTDYTPSAEDNVLVQGVGGDKGALGYFGYGYYEANQESLKVLEVDAGEGCVAPSPETIKDGSYKPLARPLYLYVNSEAAKRPEVAAYLNFYLEQAPALAPEVGMVPPDETQTTTAQTELQKVAG
jgi:phosphate transport system substrate-binding protein